MTVLEIPNPTARRSFDGILIAVGFLVVLAILLMAVPILALVLSSLGYGLLSDGSHPTLDNFRQILGDPNLYSVLWNTLVVGAGTIVVMLAFTIPFAWLYTRTDFPRKDLLMALLTVKIAVPGFLIAMGYIFLFSPENGIGNQFMQRLTGVEAMFNVYSIPWIIFLQGAALTSPAFFMIVPTMRAIDGALEEAAWASGIRKFTTVLRIVVPLSAPAILATCIYFFIIAVEMFDYAGMLGLPSRIYVLSTWIYHLIYLTDGLPEYGPPPLLASLGQLPRWSWPAAICGPHEGRNVTP